MPKCLITPEFALFIRDNYLKMTASDMSRILGVDSGVVSRYMAKNNLRVPKELASKWRSGKMYRPFTPAEDKYIIENLPVSSINKISTEIKRTSAYVGRRARELGLGHIIEQNVINHRIKPGNVPANKGLKQVDYMTPEAIEKTKHTRFQKGQRPHNTYGKPGLISIRKDHKNRGGKPYKYYCIDVGNWRPLHQYLWEEKFGKVPKGYCLWFKDGDTMNCDLDNLEMITRKENRIRNTGHYKLDDNYIATMLVGGHRKEEKDPALKQELLKHPDLLDLKRKQLQLNRAIKSHDKNENGK